MNIPFATKPPAATNCGAATNPVWPAFHWLGDTCITAALQSNSTMAKPFQGVIVDAVWVFASMPYAQRNVQLPGWACNINIVFHVIFHTRDLMLPFRCDVLTV